MPRLAAVDLYQLARAAGLDQPRARIAAAVALAESGGDPAAVGDIDKPTKGCRSYGLWQINSCPGRDKTGVRADTAALLTPQGNARAMAAISNKGATFTAWTTYRNQAYKAQLPTVDAQAQWFYGASAPSWSDVAGLIGAGAGVAIGGPASVAGGPVASAAAGGGALDVVSLLAKLADPHSWYVVALFVLGLVLVVLGGLVIFRKPLGQVAGAAVAVA